MTDFITVVLVFEEVGVNSPDVLVHATVVTPAPFSEVKESFHSFLLSYFPVICRLEISLFILLKI